MSCHKLAKNGINRQCLSHTQNMEKRIKQKTILTNAKRSVDFALESAYTVGIEENRKSETEKGKGMFLSPQDAEEYRAYKRRKKVEEIMAAIAKSEASLLNGEDPQRVCERAIRLKQTAIKVPPSWLPKAKTYLGGSKVKIDCVIGGNGETLTKVKAYEMRMALRENAKELTIFLAPSLLTHGKFAEIKKELKKLCRVAKRAVIKVWINSDYPFATLSKVARICCEVGVKYFCVPYFSGCEKLRFDLTNGCQIEVSEVETLAEYRKLCEAGVGRIVTCNIWEIYSEWMKEADRIREEGITPPQTMSGRPMSGQSTSVQKAVEQERAKTDKILPSQEEKKTEEKKEILPAMKETPLLPLKNAEGANKNPDASLETKEKPINALPTGEKTLQPEMKNETKQEVVQNGSHTRLEGSDLKFI